MEIIYCCYIYYKYKAGKPRKGREILCLETLILPSYFTFEKTPSLAHTSKICMWYEQPARASGFPVGKLRIAELQFGYSRKCVSSLVFL